MFASTNRGLILGFVAWVAKEIYDVYRECQPPVDDAAGIPWDLHQEPPVDIRVFLATTRDPPPPGVPPQQQQQQHVPVGVFEAVRPSEDATRPDLHVGRLGLPAPFLRNGTIYLHVVVVPHGRQGAAVRQVVKPISRHILTDARLAQTRYLLAEPAPSPLGGGAEETPKPVAALPRIVEVGFVQELRPLHPLRLEAKGLGDYVQGDKVKLPLYVNTHASPRDEYQPLVETSGSGNETQPSFSMRLRNVGLAYWTMQLLISKSFDEAETMYGMNAYDIDSFKQAFGGSSLYKILFVYSIGILHLVFEFLAFESDISFWRAKTSFEGLSSSSVAMQACMNVIMFLYVQEQHQTKFVMYFIAFRFCLQLWKLSKLTALVPCQGWPFVRWVNRGGGSTSLEELHDIQASERRCMLLLMALLLPLVGAFCVYRLVWMKFRSWYSWIVLSLAISSQTCGFVIMTPQVFMNYRLKSVDHLPWRALTYQAVNTFIDDVFVLCIRVPEVQKYSVFRDDIIFAVCCAQRWLYGRQAGSDPVPPLAGAAAPPGESRPSDRTKED